MSNSRISVLHAVTDSMSTVLMRGQLAYLKANGFEPALLSAPGKELQEVAVEEECAVFGIPMQREISLWSDVRSFVKICQLLRRIKPVICNCGTPKAGLLVGLAAWLNRVPCRVYTLRGLRLETARGIKKSILRLAEKAACFSAHQVICVSASLRERAITLGLATRSKTVLLGTGSSNGVDVIRFQPNREMCALAAKLRQELKIYADQPVIGFAGRFTRDKGLPELVAAFQLVRRKLQEAVLLLIGDFEEGDPVPDEIRDAIKQHPGIRHVRFTSQIELYYLVMNVFVLPTHREGFPNTVLEAQAAGVPVVTTEATGAIDSVEDGITGVLTPVGDVDRLSKAVLWLLSHPTKSQAMGHLGRERVLRKFRNETVWREMVSLYGVMLEERCVWLPVGSNVETERCTRAR
jgi:glycosyltransferase involved in cell wall biosynthesis